MGHYRGRDVRAARLRRRRREGDRVRRRVRAALWLTDVFRAGMAGFVEAIEWCIRILTEAVARWLAKVVADFDAAISASAPLSSKYV